MMTESGKIRLTFLSADGASRTIDADVGITLKDAALEHAIPDIIGECGGYAACGTCHVYIDDQWKDCLNKPGIDEAAMLDCILDRRGASRLGCQITTTFAMNGMLIRVPERQF